MTVATNIIKATIIVALASLLGWRILVNGLADYYGEQRIPEAIASALHWRSDQSAALYWQGLALSERDETVAAERSLRAAGWENPADARVFLTLGELYVNNNQQAAQKLVEFADVLAPMRSPVLGRSANFWLHQNRLDRVLARWRVLLLTRPAVSSQLYPILLDIAENQQARSFLQPLLDNPPKWWDRFFVYAASKADRLETVMFLYQRRNRNGQLPAAKEQHVYLNLLKKEERWPDMYLAWLNGLDVRQQQGLGNLYNGGFELPVSNLGFGWHMPRVRGARIETIETYGTRGGKALHVVFDGRRVRFRHVFQYLYLEPGMYQFKGRVRSQDLQAERGLRWVIRCQAPRGLSLLTEVRSFIGTNDWQVFSNSFRVPNKNCKAQILRLELEARAALEFIVDGSIWFDDLTIVRLD